MAWASCLPPKPLGYKCLPLPLAFTGILKISTPASRLHGRCIIHGGISQHSGAGVLRATVWQALSWVGDLSASACLGCLRSRVGSEHQWEEGSTGVCELLSIEETDNEERAEVGVRWAPSRGAQVKGTAYLW